MSVPREREMKEVVIDDEEEGGDPDQNGGDQPVAPLLGGGAPDPNRFADSETLKRVSLGSVVCIMGAVMMIVIRKVRFF
jgi:hypothetical protein